MFYRKLLISDKPACQSLVAMVISRSTSPDLPYEIVTKSGVVYAFIKKKVIKVQSLRGQNPFPLPA